MGDTKATVIFMVPTVNSINAVRMAHNGKPEQVTIPCIREEQKAIERHVNACDLAVCSIGDVIHDDSL